MNPLRKGIPASIRLRPALAAALALTLLCAAAPLAAKARGKEVTLDVASGSNASYRVQEQFVGIDFPNEAVGRTTAVTGTLVLNPDGTVDSSASKLTVDLRTLKSDQSHRDHYIQSHTLDTSKYPLAVFVPQTLKGVRAPLPTHGQAGFYLAGNLTVHGVTRPVTWQGIATFDKHGASGRASTHFTFATFDMKKPKIGRLLSVADNIELDIVFQLQRP